jgi:hypothetical protein
MTPILLFGLHTIHDDVYGRPAREHVEVGFANQRDAKLELPLQHVEEP